MKFTVTDKKAFMDGLKAVQRALGTRTSLPILGMLKLDATPDGVQVSATDITFGLTAHVPAEVSMPGTLCVPPVFIDMVGNAQGPVDFSVNERTATMTITARGSRHQLKGLSGDEFPIHAAGAKPVFGLPANLFTEAVEQVAICAATDAARPVLCSVHLHAEDATLIMVAADGFRLAERTLTLAAPLGQVLDINIPAKALRDFASRARGDVVLALTDNAVELSTATLTGYIQLADGNFPDYKNIIPRDARPAIEFNVEAALRAAGAVELVARDVSNTSRFSLKKLADDTHQIEITATAAEIGQGEAEFPVATEAADGFVALNIAYLRELLGAMRTEKAQMFLGQPTAPVVFLAGGYLQYVVMPMHVGK